MMISNSSTLMLLIIGSLAALTNGSTSRLIKECKEHSKEAQLETLQIIGTGEYAFSGRMDGIAYYKKCKAAFKEAFVVCMHFKLDETLRNLDEELEKQVLEIKTEFLAAIAIWEQDAIESGDIVDVAKIKSVTYAEMGYVKAEFKKQHAQEVLPEQQKTVCKVVLDTFKYAENRLALCDVTLTFHERLIKIREASENQCTKVCKDYEEYRSTCKKINNTLQEYKKAEETLRTNDVRNKLQQGQKILSEFENELNKLHTLYQNKLTELWNGDALKRVADYEKKLGPLLPEEKKNIGLITSNDKQSNKGRTEHVGSQDKVEHLDLPKKQNNELE